MLIVLADQHHYYLDLVGEDDEERCFATSVVSTGTVVLLVYY